LAALTGAALMYFFDPQNGRRRRALLRDRMTHLQRVARDARRVTARDLSARATGLQAQFHRLLDSGRTHPSDAALHDRVRAKLGRVVSHPHAIDVSVRDGVVALSGPILADEAPRLLDYVRGITGVREIRDLLALHAEASNVSALQGGSPRTGDRFELLQDKWSPSARLLTGVTGIGLVGRALATRGLVAKAALLAGSSLLLRAGTNRQLASLAGLGGQTHPIEVQKSILIRAPLADVFEFWTRISDFPRVMSRVREVEQIDERHFHWRVAGPAGAPVEWTSEITRIVPQELIEWRCDQQSAVQHSGRVRFERQGESATRVHLQLRYVPPGGALGHALACLFGADPKRSLDADLMRMKSMLESGKQPHDAAQRRAAAETRRAQRGP
jgi:uncharacterized membrane protein